MVSQEAFHLWLQKFCNERWLLQGDDWKNAFLQQDVIEHEELRPLVHYPNMRELPQEWQVEVLQLFGHREGSCMQFIKSCYGFLD